MDVDKQKRVLVVIGLDQNLEDLFTMLPNVNPENMITIQGYEQEILQPAGFGDLMRDIIVTVYQKNIKEIYVVVTRDDPKHTGDLHLNLTNKEMQDKVETLNYLFKNSIPEFPEGNFSEWLKGKNVIEKSLHRSVNLISKHPLMPSDIIVHELFINKEKEKQMGMKM